MTKQLTVYSKTNCPACVSTQNLLTQYEVPFEVIKIDQDEAAKQMILARGFRTVPQIFIGNDVFVGGGWLGLMKLSEQEIKDMLYGDSYKAT